MSWNVYFDSYSTIAHVTCYTAIVFQTKTLHGMERDQSIAVAAYMFSLTI